MTKARDLNAPAMMATAILMALSAAVVVVLASTREAEAAYPGLNGKIAFQSSRTTGAGVHNPTGDYEIFTMNPDGTGVTQITDNTSQDATPVWSPDGQQIAFSRTLYDDNTRLGELIVSMRPDGGERSSILSQRPGGPLEPMAPVWSPDGQWIAHSRRDRQDGPEIYTRDLAQAPAESVNRTNSAGFDRNPDWQRPTLAQVNFQATGR